jgi:hypothetical protein
MNPTSLKRVLRKTIQEKKPVLIYGPPGVGKTDVITQIVEELQQKLIIFLPSISEPIDYKGLPVFNQETEIASFVPFDVLNELVTADEPTIVFVDDFGQANQSVQAALMNLFRARRVGDRQISEHITFVLATNDKNHHAGVGGILEPIKSRMISLIELTVSLEDWIQWALQKQLDPSLIGFMRLRGNELLSKFEPTTSLSNSPSPRAQEAVSTIIKMGFPRDIEFELIEGAAGTGYATEIRGFLSLFRNLVSPEEILHDPANVEIPADNPMVTYAYCGSLASVASPDNMDKIIVFAKRLPIEFQVKLIQYDCLSTNRANHETAAYTDWSIENQGILSAA